MDDLHKSLAKHINFIDEQINFISFTEKSLLQWFDPLINSISDDGAVPYLIDLTEKKRYRASPLASTIIWLNDAGLLPENVLEVMLSKLLFFRDNNEPFDTDPGNLSKLSGDKLGWSLGEGVSVWSTSLAIIALIDHQVVDITKAIQFKDSVIWLVKQRMINENGWAYQLHRNCDDNVIMTSLALRALALVQQNQNSFRFSTDEKRIINNALNNGYIYLKESIVRRKNRGLSYWCFDNKPHCAATTWAMIALREMSRVESINNEINEFYLDNITSTLNFVISRMPNKVTQWDDEQIVCEGGAKYNKQKNYYSFSSTLLPQLLSLGISPYHPKVLKQIAWLVNNPNEWKIIGYDKGKTCTFTYAMVIATLTKWALYTGRANCPHVLLSSSRIQDNFLTIFFGIPYLKSSPVQIVCKNRMWFLLSIILFIVLIKIFNNLLINTISEILIFLSTLWKDSKKDIIINVVAGFIYAGLATCGILIINKIKNVIRSWKNGKSIDFK